MSFNESRPLITIAILGSVFASWAFADPVAGQETDHAQTGFSEAQRPLPHPLQIPAAYRRAIANGTRSESGTPGPLYWQQWAEYDLDAKLDPAAHRLDGTTNITYHNNSPDTLAVLWVHLHQNLHAEGAARREEVEVTGGMELNRVSVDGVELMEADPDSIGYHVFGTRMLISPPTPIAPGATVALSFEYGFNIPQAGAGNRMGYSGDDFYFLAYWYPQIAVYDDLAGWHFDLFTGNAEFYAGFARYDIEIEAPSDWLIVSTRELQNPERTLSATVRERLTPVMDSDEIVPIVTPAEFGRGSTWADAGASIRWHFVADSVHDVSASVTRASNWDATRTPVGDRDGDGSIDYALINALYRESAPFWKEAARYSQHSIATLSEYTGYSYPWPHMTAVEGGGIIGGGMEFPMMTLIGDYNQRGQERLYMVVAHELAHMWIPMIASNNERRYAWLDEGTTTFNENRAREDFFPGRDHNREDREEYVELALRDGEGEILRWSDFHYPGAYGVASYEKPSTVLVALRGMLGEETFIKAYHEFWDRWAFKHPSPWDFFSTFEDVSGRNLDWFWSAWYQETWTLDHAIGEVRLLDGGRAEIEIIDEGLVPMPVDVVVTRENGSTERHEVPVDVWLRGAVHTLVATRAGAPIVRIDLDPEFDFPDVDRTNNTWPAEAGSGR
jgi:hypothetical protein